MTFLDLLKNPERFGAYKDVVLKALEAKYGPRINEIRQNLERSQLGMGRRINEAQRAVMDMANRRGVGLWGTTLNAQAQVAGRAMESAQLEENQANQRIEALRESQQNELLPMVQNLFTQDRNFQEDVRRYGLDYAIRKAAADQALSLGQSRLDAAELEQKAAQLEYDIANDPNVGTRAQKTQELNLIRSQIAAQNALASQRAQPPEPKETKPTAQSLAERWGVSNPGLTTNYGAFDQQMGNWAYLVQQGGVEWQDVYDWLQESRQNLVTNGVDPTALEVALRTKFFPNTTE